VEVLENKVEPMALSESFFSDRIYGMHPEMSAAIFKALEEVRKLKTPLHYRTSRTPSFSRFFVFPLSLILL
jgi:hypothetical protein